MDFIKYVYVNTYAFTKNHNLEGNNPRSQNGHLLVDEIIGEFFSPLQYFSVFSIINMYYLNTNSNICLQKEWVICHGFPLPHPTPQQGPQTG